MIVPKIERIFNSFLYSLKRNRKIAFYKKKNYYLHEFCWNFKYHGNAVWVWCPLKVFLKRRGSCNFWKNMMLKVWIVNQLKIHFDIITTIIYRRRHYLYETRHLFMFEYLLESTGGIFCLHWDLKLLPHLCRSFISIR